MGSVIRSANERMRRPVDGGREINLEPVIGRILSYGGNNAGRLDYHGKSSVAVKYFKDIKPSGQSVGLTSGLRHGIAGSPSHHAESSSSSYGPIVRSSCSPPRLAATQLLSTTQLWHTPTRTFTRADLTPSRAHDPRFREDDEADEQLARESGIEGLIKRLADKNRPGK